ncbi:ThiF family adenylyltransferase [Reichenbachiella sp. MALMAid0571]|uniref:ThiF family adenylyltransferase n=1 Tax=Reichenbachiella sp. MALMAid0571 TaxID=3143939 RepID=UPI0032DF96FC
MARSLHTDNLIESNAPLNQDLTADLDLLRLFLGKRKLSILEKDENHVVVPLELTVNLPPRGTYNSVDIRSKENVQIVFHKTKYPKVAPRVYSDRKSFPKEGISHLYVSGEGKPAPFCLVRGNYEEWYASKNITDLVIRTQNWLCDAANGSLVEDGGQFDPMRLEGYRGNMVYDHDKLNELVSNNKVFENSKNFALLLIRENEKSEKTEEYVKYPKYQVVETIDSLDNLKSNIQPILEKILQNSLGIGIKRILLGAVVWDDELRTNNQFPRYLPKNLNSLIDFCEEYEIDLRPVIHILPNLLLGGIKEFPIIVGVKRPKPIIGYTGEVEFFNFYLTFGDNDIVDNEIKNSVRVGFQSHNQPLSIRKAKQVSGNEKSLNSNVIFGCGAIGSKVVTHLIRDGLVDQPMLLFDKDKIEPHNLVRHGLLSESVGQNKAIALQNAAKAIFDSETSNLKIIGIPRNGDAFFELEKYTEILGSVNWILDFTASTSFENYFIKRQIQSTNRVCKSFITDQGNLGVQLFEGLERNPRVDDLKVLLQSEYQNDTDISSWLRREQKMSKDESLLVNVGVGCNSETTIISDDLISLHSSIFVRSIKAQTNIKPKKEGTIRLTKVNTSKDDFNIRTKTIIVNPLTVIKDAKTGWEIRIKAGVEEMLMSEMGKAMPNETGGVFIGMINNKTKCIYITDVILPPPDSEANSGCFIRGIEGLKEEVDLHKKQSGQTFGYIGEWHSHPHGPLGPSNKDISTMQRFKKDYIKEQIFMPVLVVIVTPIGLIPCLH